MLKEIENALILGKAKSGKAAQNLLNSRNINNTILDDQDINNEEFRNLCVNKNFSHCIISPGFRNSHSWLSIIKSFQIPIIPELELGWSCFNGFTIAVTGSNGKSTALKWLYETLILSESDVVIGGNYGTPVCELAMINPNAKFILIEVSSFQLEHANLFKPDIAVLLNIYPNHLDRHNNMLEYISTKCKIFGTYNNSANVCIIPFIKKKIIKKYTHGNRNWKTFGITKEADIFFEKGIIFKKNKKLVNLSKTFFGEGFLGEHTGPAIASVIDECSLSIHNLYTSALSFVNLPHRLEFIRKNRGISFINDSKSTNLTSMIAAVESCNQPIRLLVGGQLKENNINFIKEKLAQCKITLYAFGESALLFKDCCDDLISCRVSNSLNDAFEYVCEDMIPGDTVLLSPGCASFDQFKNYEERGELFKSLVNNLCISS